MIPFISDEISSILSSILKMFFLRKIVEQADDPYELMKIVVGNTDIYLPLNKLRSKKHAQQKQKVCSLEIIAVKVKRKFSGKTTKLFSLCL